MNKNLIKIILSVFLLPLFYSCIGDSENFQEYEDFAVVRTDAFKKRAMTRIGYITSGDIQSKDPGSCHLVRFKITSDTKFEDGTYYPEVKSIKDIPSVVSKNEAPLPIDSNTLDGGTMTVILCPGSLGPEFDHNWFVTFQRDVEGLKKISSMQVYYDKNNQIDADGTNITTSLHKNRVIVDVRFTMMDNLSESSIKGPRAAALDMKNVYRYFQPDFSVKPSDLEAKTLKIPVKFRFIDKINSDGTPKYTYTGTWDNTNNQGYFFEYKIIVP